MRRIVPLGICPNGTICYPIRRRLFGAGSSSMTVGISCKIRFETDSLFQSGNLVFFLVVIGPRPVVEEELAAYGDDAGELLSAKPGITGWWQVQARNDATYGDGSRQELELSRGGVSGAPRRFAQPLRGEGLPAPRLAGASDTSRRLAAPLAPRTPSPQCRHGFTSSKFYTPSYTYPQQVHRRNALTRTVGTNPSSESRRMTEPVYATARSGRPPRAAGASRLNRRLRYQSDRERPRRAGMRAAGRISLPSEVRAYFATDFYATKPATPGRKGSDMQLRSDAVRWHGAPRTAAKQTRRWAAARRQIFNSPQRHHPRPQQSAEAVKAGRDIHHRRVRRHRHEPRRHATRSCRAKPSPTRWNARCMP